MWVKDLREASEEEWWSKWEIFFKHWKINFWQVYDIKNKKLFSVILKLWVQEQILTVLTPCLLLGFILSQIISAEISFSYEGNGHIDKAMLIMSLQLNYFLKYSFYEYSHILYYRRLYPPHINLAKKYNCSHNII